MGGLRYGVLRLGMCICWIRCSVYVLLSKLELALYRAGERVEGSCSQVVNIFKAYSN